MRVKVSTKFDCRRTGVTGNFKMGSASFVDKAGQPVLDRAHWDRSRNQQRNLETLTQLLGMRTQLIHVSDPVEQNGIWTFEIEPERPDVFASDSLASVRNDCDGVPMIVKLGEDPEVEPILRSQGSDQNIWLQII